MTTLTAQDRKMPTRTLSIALPALAGALFLAAPSSEPQAQSNQDTILPGYWEYTTSALGDRDTERKCLRQSEVDRFFNGLSTRKYTCTYPTRVVGNGNARFEGTCVDRKGRSYQVRLNGTYSTERFHFDGRVQLLRGTPFLPATLSARRLNATCPAGAEYF